MFEATLTNWDSVGEELHYLHEEHHCHVCPLPLHLTLFSHFFSCYSVLISTT